MCVRALCFVCWVYFELLVGLVVVTAQKAHYKPALILGPKTLKQRGFPFSRAPAFQPAKTCSTGKKTQKTAAGRSSLTIDGHVHHIPTQYHQANTTHSHALTQETNAVLESLRVLPYAQDRDILAPKGSSSPGVRETFGFANVGWSGRSKK